MLKNRTGAAPIDGDPTLFPSGMRALADYVHALGELVRVLTFVLLLPPQSKAAGEALPCARPQVRRVRRQWR